MVTLGRSYMKNIYLFYGVEEFLIDEAISNIRSKHPNGQVIKHDLTETSISILLEDASMISLFDDEKIVIGYHADFLTGSTKKSDINHDIDALIRYIENPNPKTALILVVLNEKIDKRKNIVKKLLNKAEVKEFNKLSENEMVRYAQKLFDKNNYKISFNALHTLIDRVEDNLYLLNSECDKLMFYKMDTKIIEEADVKEMVLKYNFDNIFALTDAVIKKDIDTSLFLYQELLKRKEEPIKIIVLLANQFRLIFQVKGLSSKGLSESQIASNLGVHPYRVKLANEISLKEKDLLKYIELLANLDEDIKTGKVDKDVGLELFLLKL